MKMIEMELETKMNEGPIPYEPPKYPYGLKIELNGESLEKLGIKFDSENMPVIGTKYKVMAEAELCSFVLNEGEYGGHKCLVLQIEKLAVAKGKEEKSATAEDFYKE